jgi:hypothetical protein
MKIEPVIRGRGKQNGQTSRKGIRQKPFLGEVRKLFGCLA